METEASIHEISRKLGLEQEDGPRHGQWLFAWLPPASMQKNLVNPVNRVYT